MGIGDWGLVIRDWGSRFGFRLGLGIGIWNKGFGIRIETGSGDLIWKFLRY